MPENEGLEFLDPPADEMTDETTGEENDFSDTEIVFDEFTGNGGETFDDVLSDDVSDPASSDLPSDSSDSVSYDVPADAPASDESLDEEESDASILESDSADGTDLDSPESTVYLLTFDGESVPFTVTALDSLDPVPLSVTASTNVYTPQAWQVNLAENRSFGEHYLMWARRVSSGSSSYYWQYYLALGRDITYSSNVYTYADAELYTYYSYNSSVTYDVSISSGTVSGSSYLVYSDLYFDYVGVDPAFKGSVYIFFALMMIMIALIVIGGKRNV